jgi:hypothetical protein
VIAYFRHPMTNLLKQAIGCDDGDAHVKQKSA